MALGTQILTSADNGPWQPNGDYDSAFPVKIETIGKGGTGQDGSVGAGGRGGGGGGRSVFNSVMLPAAALCTVSIGGGVSEFDADGLTYSSSDGQNGEGGGAGGQGWAGSEIPDEFTNGGSGGLASSQAGGGGGEAGGAATGDNGDNAAADVGGAGGTGGTGADGGKGGDFNGAGVAGQDYGGGGGGGGKANMPAGPGGAGAIVITYTKIGGGVNRYAVASGNVNDTAIWAETSGGAPGASVPGAADIAILDPNSRGITVTMNVALTVSGFDARGFSGTLAGGGAINVAGSFRLSRYMTLTANGLITINATSGEHEIDLDGVPALSSFTINAPGAIVRLANNLITGPTRLLTITAGDFYSMGFTIGCGTFIQSGAAERKVFLGNSTINLALTGGTPWSSATVTNLTFDAGTSTIRYTGNSAGLRTFQGGGLMYYNFEFGGPGAGDLSLPANASFDGFFRLADIPQEVVIAAGVTIAARSWAVSGTPGNVNSFVSGTPGVAANLQKMGGGQVQLDYCTFTDCACAPGTFYGGPNSTVTNCTGIVAAAAPLAIASLMRRRRRRMRP